MKRLIAFTTLTLAALTGAAQAEDMMYSHLVFFDLKDDSAEARQALVDGFDTYLAPHDGIVVYTASIRDADKQRDVNDGDFDVALTIIFDSEEAQDAYQITDAHKQFIAELSDNWERVRVFDSQIAGAEFNLGG